MIVQPTGAALLSDTSGGGFPDANTFCVGARGHPLFVPDEAVAVARAPGRFDVEPLAAMGARESRLIIDLVKDLASSGRISIIVIDHNYAHLFELCDRINVLQGGRITIDQPVHETSLEKLTELMVSSYRSQLEEISSDDA